MKKEHQTEFKCKECQFRTKYKIVRRRHMLNAHKKPCERCDHVGTSENDLNAHKQAEHGILMSSVGFMLTNSDPVPHDAEILDNDAQNAERSVKRRKTKTEYTVQFYKNYTPQANMIPGSITTFKKIVLIIAKDNPLFVCDPHYCLRGT